MSLEAHVHQKDQIIQQLLIFFRRTEQPLSQLVIQQPLKCLQLLYNHWIAIMFLERDVKKQEFVPRGVEELIQEGILLSITPQRNKGKVVFSRCLLIALENQLIDVELMKIFKESNILRRVWVRELNEYLGTMMGIDWMVTSSSSSKKAACSMIIFQICSSLLKLSGSGVISRSGLMNTPARCS